MMKVDENVKSFALYGSETPLSKEQFKGGIVLILLFLIPMPFIRSVSIIAGVCAICLFVSYIFVVYYCQQNITKKGIAFLYNGAMMLCLSLIFLLDGLRVSQCIHTRVSWGMFAILCLGIYLVFGVVLWGIIRLMIRNGVYQDAKKSSKANKRIVFYLTGICGIMVARQLITGLDQNGIFGLIAICCVFLSCLCLMGTPNLLKYYLIKRYFSE